MSDEQKEERLHGFQKGDIRVLVTKPKIGCFGLNWQHCSEVVCFPSHSYEAYYQLVRRCYRFGQTKPVNVHVISTEGEHGILANLQRKSEQASRMFDALVANMHEAMTIDHDIPHNEQTELPQWLT